MGCRDPNGQTCLQEHAAAETETEFTTKAQTYTTVITHCCEPNILLVEALHNKTDHGKVWLRAEFQLKSTIYVQRAASQMTESSRQTL